MGFPYFCPETLASHYLEYSAELLNEKEMLLLSDTACTATAPDQTGQNPSPPHPTPVQQFAFRGIVLYGPIGDVELFGWSMHSEALTSLSSIKTGGHGNCGLFPLFGLF